MRIFPPKKLNKCNSKTLKLRQGGRQTLTALRESAVTRGGRVKEKGRSYSSGGTENEGREGEEKDPKAGLLNVVGRFEGAK